MFKRSGLVYLIVQLAIAAPSTAFCAVPEIPVESKTLAVIVLDVKALLNRKLEELRKTYAIREVKAGGFHFIGKDGEVVMTIETHRTLNPAATQRVEEFLYRNNQEQLLLHEKVITQGENLSFHDFEARLYQTGVENYDLEDDDQTRKEATISMDGAVIFKVLSSRERGTSADIKRHQIWVGDLQQIEIRDTIYARDDYRTYEYEILEQQVLLLYFKRATFAWARWDGTFRIGVRTSPTLLLPEVTYARIGTDNYVRLNGLEAFSMELHEKLIIPFIERGVVRAIKEAIEIPDVWPKSQSMQNIGSDSKFLNELIVIRNEVNQAKSNPAVLSLIEVKLNVIIRDIEAGALKINDFR